MFELEELRVDELEHQFYYCHAAKMNSIGTLPHFLEYYTDISDLNIIFASYFGLLQFQYLNKHDVP